VAGVRAPRGKVLLSLARTRVEAGAIELQEERLRSTRLAVRIAVAVALGASDGFIGMGVLALWMPGTTGDAVGACGLDGVAFGAWVQIDIAWPIA